MSSFATTLARFEKSVDVRLSPGSAAAEVRLVEVMKTYAISRLSSLGPASKFGCRGQAIVGVLAHQAVLSPGWLAWTLLELRTDARNQEACVIAVVPVELAHSAGVGQVVCLLTPGASISTSLTSVVLVVSDPNRVVVLGRARDAAKCTKCGIATNKRFGPLCPTHRLTESIRVKCDRMDVASRQPRCHIVGMPVKQLRMVSTGCYRLDGAELKVDKQGRATLGECDGLGGDDEHVVARMAEARDDRTRTTLLERFPQPKGSIGARYLNLANRLAEEEKSGPASKKAAAQPAASSEQSLPPGAGPALDPAAAVTPGPHGAKSPGTHQLATTSAVAAARTEGDSGAFSEPAKVAQAYRFSWEAMTQRESRAI